MSVLTRDDFKYELTIDGGPTYVLREITPRDFYWFALIENDYPDLDKLILNLQTLALLMEGDEDILMTVNKLHVGPLIWWMMQNLLNEKIMTLQSWYEVSFHLCKQRFDSTMGWLEDQPISKVLLMIQTLTKYAKEQEREMKKARRKR